MVRDFADVPRDAERVIFFPRAAGGAVGWRRTMLLALSATLIVIVALLWEVVLADASEALERHRARRAPVARLDDYDPGRERRAEQRARQLLRSCVNDEEWEMYRDLGLLRVWGAMAAGPTRGASAATGPARRTPT